MKKIIPNIIKNVIPTKTVEKSKERIAEAALELVKKEIVKFPEIIGVDELYDFFTPQNQSKPEIHGGFAQIHWNRDTRWEEQLKNDLKVTVRCIPDGESESGDCLFSGEKSPGRVVVAKSY